MGVQHSTYIINFSSVYLAPHVVSHYVLLFILHTKEYQLHLKSDMLCTLVKLPLPNMTLHGAATRTGCTGCEPIACTLVVSPLLVQQWGVYLSGLLEQLVVWSTFGDAAAQFLVQDVQFVAGLCQATSELVPRFL